MPFPEVKRVIYKKNPLDKVICQLRFPPILKIDSDIPAEFQDRLRRDFPNFSEQTEIKIEVPEGIKMEVPLELVKKAIQSSGIKNYQFSSEDGQWQVNLTRTFIALSANKYERWEQFKDKLTNPLRALIDIYAPTYFSRIGLRYVDVIRRSILGLNDLNWRELLQPYVLGILSAPIIGENVQGFDNKYNILLSDGESKVKIIMKYVEPSDGIGEKCYVIDSDFYNTNKTNFDEANGKLDYFNNRATRLIQWCITRRLHLAMEPEEI
jgi:uncharacterized protein (TIGR04255 family)